MPHPGITFAVMIGVALGAAVYYFITNNNVPPHSQKPEQPSDYYVPPNPSTRYDTHPRRRRNSNLNSCSICLDRLRGKTQETITCGHVFHTHCIIQWLKKNTTCPVCRATVYNA